MIGILSSFLPFAIRFAEQIINKPKGGTDRKALVRDLCRAVLERAAAVESATAEKPTDPEIDGAIEMVFQQAKQSGALTQAIDDETALIIIRGRYDVLPLKGIAK